LALPPPLEKRRRFYAAVDVAPAERGGWAVKLDGRVPRSADDAPLVLPTEPLARLVAAEWSGQGGTLDPASMGATRLAWATMAAGAREAAVERIVAFGKTDLLCYFAEGPAALAERQEQQWGRVIDWAWRELGLGFRRSVGVAHQAQPPETIQEIEALARAEKDFALAGLDAAVALFGSAILGLALRRGALSADAAFDLSRLDEAFQQERWGIDSEAAARTEAMRREARMLAEWFETLD